MALELWVEFFDDLENIRGRSRNTVMAYRRDLELFDEYAHGQSSAHELDIPGFYLFMKKRKLSPRSQARVVSSLHRRASDKLTLLRAEKADDADRSFR